MVHVLCVMGGNKLYGCDTSKTGYPLDPQHRIDITLSTKPKLAIRQVARGEAIRQEARDAMYHARGTDYPSSKANGQQLCGLLTL